MKAAEKVLSVLIGCLGILAIIAALWMFGAGVVMAGYAWLVDHVFVGALEQGLMVSRLQWVDGFIVVAVVAVLQGFAIGGSFKSS